MSRHNERILDVDDWRVERDGETVRLKAEKLSFEMPLTVARHLGCQLLSAVWEAARFDKPDPEE